MHAENTSSWPIIGLSKRVRVYIHLRPKIHTEMPELRNEWIFDM